MPDNPLSAPNRCAIYTRKSTNSRLDHEVNSLTTQHEICSAYIASQRYRGWTALLQRYDDGGHSGSGLERPALAALMQDIEAGEIDTVVVYKIDRLTRSLLDFVRLIEIFDRRSIGLVSVSQAFDTTDSMGRMILNVLLTFSQFERELIAERVRDSIRTRKRHGRIHGGLAPFGYEYRDGELEVVEAEAEIVRFIYAAFLRHGTYTAAMTAVREAGFCSSLKTARNGSLRGGRPMSPGSVYNILRNPIYVGEIRGHDRTWPGRHAPIIERTTWDAACALAAKRTRKGPSALGTDHFLAGILWDDLGRHMLLDVNWVDGQPYHFYVSSNAQWSQAEYRRAYRSRADRLDAVALAALGAFLTDRSRLRAALRTHGLFGAELDRLAEHGGAAACRLANAPPSQVEALIAALLIRIEVAPEALTMEVRPIELRRFLEWDGQGTFVGRQADWSTSNARYAIEVPVSVIAAERWPSFTVRPRDPTVESKPDKQLKILLRNARAAQALFDAHRDLDLVGLAQRFGRSPGYFSRLIRLNYLAPDIVAAIADGTQPPGLNRKTLASAHIPLDWTVQRRMFGFPEPSRPVTPRNLFGRGMWPSRGEDDAGGGEKDVTGETQTRRDLANLLHTAVELSGRNRCEIAREADLHKDALRRTLIGERSPSVGEALRILASSGMAPHAHMLLFLGAGGDQATRWLQTDIARFFEELICELPAALERVLGNQVHDVKPRWAKGTAHRVARLLADHIDELERKDALLGDIFAATVGGRHD